MRHSTVAVFAHLQVTASTECMDWCYRFTGRRM